MAQPQLFYLSPEWDRDGALIRDSLVWNALEGNHASIDSWTGAFNKRVKLEKSWKAPATMLEKGKQDADFIAACRTTFALTPKAWKAIRDLVGDTAEALEVQVTHTIVPTEFDFLPIPPKKQPDYLLLHGLYDIPIRHGQSGYWNVEKSQYDMSSGKYSGAPPELCKQLKLDPAEFEGKHLFLLQGEWIASAEFVERVKAKKLTGLVFHPIEYESTARRVSQPLKKVMPEPPKPDFASAEKGFTPKLGKQWDALWKWTVEAFKNRGWAARPAKLGSPVPAAKVTAFEKKHGIKLPRDYVDVLTKLASKVTLDLGWVTAGDPKYDDKEEIGRRIRELMFGGPMLLWSFDFPVKEYPSFKDWADSIADEEPDNEYLQHFRNKLPILGISNGDYIALDLKTGAPTYLSHDGDDQLQGKPLGKNFCDFVTRWSWASLPWPDFLPGTDFYHEKSHSIPTSSRTLECWHAWLRGAPLPPEGERR